MEITACYISSISFVRLGVLCLYLTVPYQHQHQHLDAVLAQLTRQDEKMVEDWPFVLADCHGDGEANGTPIFCLDFRGLNARKTTACLSNASLCKELSVSAHWIKAGTKWLTDSLWPVPYSLILPEQCSEVWWRGRLDGPWWSVRGRYDGFILIHLQDWYPRYPPQLCIPVYSASLQQLYFPPRFCLAVWTAL